MSTFKTRWNAAKVGDYVEGTFIKKKKGRNPEHYEDNQEVSQTVPDGAMTIQEILERAQRGETPITKFSDYMPVEDASQIDKFYGTDLDITDIDELNSRKAAQDEAYNNALKAMQQYQVDGGLEGEKNMDVENPPLRDDVTENND
jgi:hypothetical protein